MLFDYDHTRPMNLDQTSFIQEDGLPVRTMSYTDLADQRVTAYWIAPASTELYPAVLYVHPSPGNKDAFRPEAVMLAQRGAASLVIDAPWSLAAFGKDLGQPQGAYNTFVPIIRNLRRAIDVIVAQPNVDAHRIGYVGHSFGALCGGVLAGVEKRVKAYALLAGTSSFADVAVLNMPGIQGQPLEEAYKRIFAPIDPIAFVDKAVPAALLFQFGERDKFPREHMMTFAEAGSAPKTVIWYDVDHYAVNETGRTERLDWLCEQLGLRQYA